MTTATQNDTGTQERSPFSRPHQRPSAGSISRRRAEKEVLRARDELELRVIERTAELESKNAEMERFICTVSQDLRSPLVTVNGFVGFLKTKTSKGAT